MKVKIMKINKILFFLLLLFFSCNGQNVNEKNKEYKGKYDIAFKNYLIQQKIQFKELNDSIYSAHYLNFIKYERKLILEKNPFLKVNKVYLYYITPSSVEFKIFADDGTFCLSTFDLDMDGKILSFPENGVVKVLEPIQVVYFGDYEIKDNIIKTRKRRVSPYNETYYYVNGSIKNDTIYFTEKYVGKEKKFEKKTFAKTYKDNFIEVYQPNLTARKYINGAGLICYEVTGEFNVEKKEKEEASDK